MNISKSLFFLFFFFFFSCNHTQIQNQPKERLSIVVDKDTMWKAIIKTFKDYPLKNIDPQIGYLETELIKGDLVWKAPHQKSEDLYGYSYTIQVYLSYKNPISTVNIYKKNYKQKGFISQKEEVPSDYLEETALFYHILRELELKKKLDT